MKRALLEASELTVQAGAFKLDDVSFALDRQQYMIVLGPTGCGKTMLLETLAGLRKPASGRIFRDGSDITGWPPEERGFGFAYQDSLLYPFLDVKANILLGAKAKNRHKDKQTLKRVEQLAEAMGISGLLARFPKALSGGEKQRVSLARAILLNPPVLLLDEPLSALDPQTRGCMRQLLHEIHQAEGLGIIHVTHDFQEALQLGTQILVMDNGRVLQAGQPQQVFHRPDSVCVADFLQTENIVKGRIQTKAGSLWFIDQANQWACGPIGEGDVPHGNPNEIYMMIHAGQIEVTANDSADRPNTWQALIKKMVVNSTHVDLVCQGSGVWNVALSRHEMRRLDLRTGQNVVLAVEPGHTHLVAGI